MGCFVGECCDGTDVDAVGQHPSPNPDIFPHSPPSLPLLVLWIQPNLDSSLSLRITGEWGFGALGGDRERGGGEEEVATHRKILRGALMKRGRERERERQRGMPRRKQVSLPLSNRGVRAMSPFASRAGVARAVLSERSGGIPYIVTGSSLLSA